jgi:hypothetical protein
MSEDDERIKHGFELAEARMLLEAGAMTIGKLQAEIKELKEELERMKHIRDVTELTLNAELERVTRARDIACFNIVDLNHQRAQLTGALEAALRLIDYLLSEIRAAGVVPSVACVVAKKALDDEMARLFKFDGKPQLNET